MEPFNFYELMNTIDRQRYVKPYYNKLANFLEHLTYNDILGELKEDYDLFYPMYLWQEDKQLVIYFITITKIVECSYNKEENISMITRFTKDVELIKTMEYNAAHYDIELNLHFTNGKVITFSSNDSNENWKRKYFEKISQIQKFLLSNL